MVPPPESPHRTPIPAEVRGRGSALFVLGFFGALWLNWGISTSPGLPVAPFAAVGIAVLAMLLVGGVRLMRLANTLPPAPLSPEKRAMSKYWIIVGVEFATLIAVSVGLASVGLPHLVAAAVCAGVGLHFLPLSTLFDIPLYRSTGYVMCGLATTTLLVGGILGTPGPLWQLIPGLGSAATLWISAAVLHRQTRALVAP